MKYLVLFLLFATACGDNGQLHSEIAELQVSVRALETRLGEVEAEARAAQAASQRNATSPPKSNRAQELPEESDTLDAVDEIERVADLVCACKDVPCAEAAMKILEKLKDTENPDASGIKRVEKSMKKMMECMTTLAINAK